MGPIDILRVLFYIGVIRVREVLLLSSSLFRPDPVFIFIFYFRICAHILIYQSVSPLKMLSLTWFSSLLSPYCRFFHLVLSCQLFPFTSPLLCDFSSLPFIWLLLLLFPKRAFGEPPKRALLYWNKHFRTDELLGAWLFLFGTVPAVPYTLVFFLIDPSFTYLGR